MQEFNKGKKKNSKIVLSKGSLVDCTYRKYSHHWKMHPATNSPWWFSEGGNTSNFCWFQRQVLVLSLLACPKDGWSCWIGMKLCTICFCHSEQCSEKVIICTYASWLSEKNGCNLIPCIFLPCSAFSNCAKWLQVRESNSLAVKASEIQRPPHSCCHDDGT